MYESLLKDCVITQILDPVVAGTSTQTTDVLDMAGFDGCLIICSLGDVTSGSVLTLTAKENTANSVSSPTPVAVTGGATAAFTADASSADNKLLIVDVVRPSYRYLFATLTRATQNAVINSIIAIQYRGKSLPVTQSSDVIASALSTPEA